MESGFRPSNSPAPGPGIDPDPPEAAGLTRPGGIALKKPDKNIQPKSEAEEKAAEEIQDEELDDVAGGALNLTGTIGTADLRSIRVSKDVRRIKKLP